MRDPGQHEASSGRFEVAFVDKPLERIACWHARDAELGRYRSIDQPIFQPNFPAL
ncbi:MAG: hypothetical protein Rhirs2KO_22040 [Rhizobiaceae bacterium]